MFQIATGDQELSATQIATELLLSRLGGGASKLLKLLPKKTQDYLKKAYDGVACFFNSFPEGTLIHIEKGLVAIEDIRIGDKVLAYDSVTGETRYEEVTHLIQNEGEYNLVVLEVEGGEVIEATPEHPFYIDAEWIQANEIAASDSLTALGGYLLLDNIKRSFRREKVFNLTVDSLHTFYVGETGILVHNQNKKQGCKFRGKKAKGFNWDHIFDRHSSTGNIAKQRTRSTGNTVFPANLTKKQIKARVTNAWKNRELRRSQLDPATGETRLFYEGFDPGSGTAVGFWFNSKTGIVESAFPR